MKYCLGIDTSNYTTSAAVCCVEDMEIVSNNKRLLAVKSGECGLRQSDAVFQHIKALPEIISGAVANVTAEDKLVCVAVSDKPSEQEGSYMPCFLSGIASAKAAALASHVECYNFSHQAGHIAAALYSAGRMDLIHQKFIAFHVSGGTTQALLVEPDKDKIFKISCIGGSNDLKAGQAVDRIGGMMGLDFPAGPALELLANESEKVFNPRPIMREDTFSLSGLENMAKKMMETQESPQDIARFTLDFIAVSIIACVENLIAQQGEMPVVFAGGVMSNKIIRSRVESQFECAFAEPVFSSDNAAGIALLGAMSYLRGI